MAEPYFASLNTSQCGNGPLWAFVDNTGENPLPGNWVHVNLRVQPVDGGNPVDLGWVTGSNEIPVGGDALIGPFDVGAVPNGFYTVVGSMFVRDGNDYELCVDHSDHLVEVEVHQGAASYYERDTISGPELGDVFADPTAFSVAWDPHPYVSDGGLVVTARNDGTYDIDAGNELTLEVDGQQVGSVSLGQALAAGSSFSHTFELPNHDEGNVDAKATLSYAQGRAKDVDIRIVYQGLRPVDVLQENL
jgi:hypothetical protein